MTLKNGQPTLLNPVGGNAASVASYGTTITRDTYSTKQRPWVDPVNLGAVADGTSHPLSTRYATLAAAQAAYPNAGITALTQEIDWAVLQDLLNGGLPTSGVNAGGVVVIAGHYYCGNDGLTSTTPGVWLLGLGSHGWGTNPGNESSVISGTGSQVLLTLGQAGTTNHQGWRFDNITLRDLNDALTGLLRLIRFNHGRMFNVLFDFNSSAARGYAVQLDGTGDSCQYNNFVACHGRNVHQGYTYVNKADDTTIIGGSMLGNNGVAGSVGCFVGDSMRVMGANIQGFERNYVITGNNPSVSDARCDTSGMSTLTTVHMDVLAGARDAKIINPMFAGSYPSTAHIRLALGQQRTNIVAPSSNGASWTLSVDPSDTSYTLLDAVNGSLVLSGKALTKHASGVLQASSGTAGLVKAGAIADADFAATPPDGAWGINTTAGSLMYRAGGGWKSLAPVVGNVVGKVAALTSEVTVSNTTAETVVATYTLPGGTAVAGTTIRMKFGGKTDNVATSGTLIIRVRVGGLTGVQVFTVTLSSGTGARTGSSLWFEQQTTFRSVGAAAVLAGIGRLSGSLSTANTETPNVQTPGSTVDSRSGLDFVVTAQWATADPGNVLYAEVLTTEILP